MPVKIHPQARKTLAHLELPGPIQKMYFAESTATHDLTNSTNFYGGSYAEYPSLNPIDVKKTYIKALSLAHQTSYPHDPFPEIPLDHLLFTVGSIEGIDLMIRGFCEPLKDTVCVLEPSFPAYAHWSKIHGITVKSIPFRGSHFDVLNPREIVQLNPKILFLCNPNNPTGTLISNDVILEMCSSLKGLVVVDEAYIEFADQPSILSHLSDLKNLVVLRTLSKAWGMAGLRCGAIFADPSILETLRYIQIPFGFSTPAQHLVHKRLASPHGVIASWDRIKKSRDRLLNSLENLSCVSLVYKSNANFLLVCLKDHSAILKALQAENICVADCSYVVPNSVKISVSHPKSHRAFLTVLERFSKK